MTDPFIKYGFVRPLLWGIVLGLAISCRSTQASRTADLIESGVYAAGLGGETLYLNSDGTFMCLRGSKKSHPIVSQCDTLASGSWVRQKSFITLKNHSSFDKIVPIVIESEKGSMDSVYFDIEIPMDDGFDKSKFTFTVATSPLYDKINESSSLAFSVPKSGRIHAISLIARNTSPHCEFGSKCYQRIYFIILDGYVLQKTSSNYFRISLTNFTQCFYDSIDLNGEIIGVEHGKLFWRGKIYERIDESK